jgi:molybdopterin/thiamine biosynthesis adenylyltransferase
MLARLDRVVSAVSVTCPSETAAASCRVVPFAPADATFVEALQAGASAVGIDSIPIDFSGQRHAMHLVLGPGKAVGDALRVHGEGWCGGFTRNVAVDGYLESALPVGPYLAAAFAVGEIFKAVRLVPERYEASTAAFYSAWTHAAYTEMVHSGPSELTDVFLQETIAGVGAVGCICAHTLWAIPGVRGRLLLVDGDKKGIDVTNLNRCLLFGPKHLGLRKASTARDVLVGPDISWIPFDGYLEEAPRPQRHILCAVDTNPSRLTVQSCWPASLLMASTNELRAEVVRCDPRRGGPCARCFNHHDDATPDDELQRRFREASPEEQKRLAVAQGATAEDAREWAYRGACGTTGDRVRDALRNGESRGEAFAVPFVSCAAGTLLAAETVKEQLDAPMPLSPRLARAVVQFWRPAQSAGAKLYRRDPTCPTCRPGTDAMAAWFARTADRPIRGDAGQRR